MIEFKNVFLRYDAGPYVLKDICLNITPGSFFFLTGASGAGKSSLLKLMYLDHPSTNGDVYVLNKNTKLISRQERALIKQQIGIVFQESQLLDHLTVFDNVALPLRFQNRPNKEIKEYVYELLHWVGLGGYVDAYPTTLSGGQQQRVAIARSVINHPKILIADEPTGNVDDQIATRLINLFEELNKTGTTVIIATHNEQLMEEFGYPRLLLSNSQIHLNQQKQILTREQYADEFSTEERMSK